MAKVKETPLTKKLNQLQAENDKLKARIKALEGVRSNLFDDLERVESTVRSFNRLFWRLYIR